MINIKDRIRREKEWYKNGEEEIFEDIMEINFKVKRKKEILDWKGKF